MTTRLLTRDNLLSLPLFAAAVLCGTIVLLMAGFVIGESWIAWQHIGGGRFLSDDSWHPADAAQQGTFRLIPAVVGTLLTTVGAICLAAPLGILAATFPHYYAPRIVARLFRRMVELLAGIPSVVYGLWGLVVLVPLIARWEPPGASLLAGIVILAIMILPTVALLADSAFASVPRSYLEGAAALGLPRATIVTGIVLPAAAEGVVTAVLLATVRAIGETMAVLMVCGNVPRIPGSLFDPIRTLTATIALEMGYARLDHRGALFACGVVLLLMVVALVSLTELFSRRRQTGAV